jgi:hypothetical protein
LLHTVKKTILLSIAIILLASCSNTAPKIKPTIITTPVSDAQSPIETADSLLLMAASQDHLTALNTLSKASQLLLSEQKPLNALWLANSLYSKVQQPTMQRDLLIVETRALLALEEYSRASEKFAATTELLTQNKLPFTFDYYDVKRTLAAHDGDKINMLSANLYRFSLNKNSTTDDVQSIWHQLNSLTQWQLDQLNQQQPPYFYGWYRLLQVAHKFGDNQTTFNQQLSKWQQQHANHPANSIIELLKQQSLATTPVELNNIAVILPLSGKQKSAGEAAQQGILAAYERQPNATLHFIDSNKQNLATIAEFFKLNNIDAVIGPLLKNNVDAYIAQDISAIPTLLLNSPINQQLHENHIIFSLTPEEESIQAAETLSNNKFKHPLVISHSDSLSKRIAQTFVSQWFKQNGQRPEIVYFTQGKEMQQQLQQSLAVDTSKQRILNLRARLKETIKTETRNRRDIDMIYLVGNSKQTRLLKPYIDVYTSPFADIIPVFASSRSHSAKQDRKDIRDLAGLTFTEIPWLLSSKQQDKDLAALNLSLWRERTDSLQRIFALGFDSLPILTKLSAIQQFDYIRHYGQTGIIQKSENQQLVRSLIWGKYRTNSVSEISVK